MFCFKNTDVLEKKHLYFERKTPMFFLEKLLEKIGGRFRYYTIVHVKNFSEYCKQTRVGHIETSIQ